MYFDRMLMRQALNNLIQNAIDAIRDRGSIWISSSLVHPSRMAWCASRSRTTATG